MQQETPGWLFEEPVSNDVVIAILANDLAHMTEAQLAEMLTTFFLDGPGAIADALAPLARRELAERRFIAQFERIVETTPPIVSRR